MYHGRRGINFGSLCLVFAIFCRTLHALTLPLLNLPHTRNATLPLNITVGANEILNVVVIPRNQKTVAQIKLLSIELSGLAGRRWSSPLISWSIEAFFSRQ